MRNEEVRSPSCELRCVLCKRADETEITGALNSKQGVTAHQNCLLYASNIYCKNSPSYDDLFGFEVEDVEKETQRGRKLKCHYCDKKGATAGCEVKSCRRSYHYPCAKMDGAQTVESDSTFRLYCPRHNPIGSTFENPEATPSNKGHKNSLGGFKSDSETPRRSRTHKRRHQQSFFASDESQSIFDVEMAPIESEFEDNMPLEKSARTDFEPKSEDFQRKREGVDSASDESSSNSDFESQSLLEAEYHQENVLFMVIADSGPSTESAAENSSDHFLSATPSPADLHSNIPISPNPQLPTHPCSSVSGTVNESCKEEVELFKDLPVKPISCASPDLPLLHMNYENELRGHVDALDSAAAIFWRRCNELGCTESIFTELTRQLSDLAERLRSQNATQQDYNVSLGILKASGRLPAIVNQIEQDIEHQEKQLQKKQRALNDAKAVLKEKQLI